ncbi:hypothetical protein BRETT_003765 [Brettanomyces bruxellensis]|uniref:Uncharacterized protein n=1 Tax=Dekkera bruxellensis TaxID=5007 RepID=A0A871R5Y6_DEKBR|nr:uncharacterized protein BRETT_003765 [Brettanomyces bruxellensis]QOU19615.1 hypothetical protein BRETT_003765 [Brettanomyces bruxellensis]
MGLDTTIKSLEGLADIDFYNAVHSTFLNAQKDGSLIYSADQKPEIIKEDGTNMNIELKTVKALGIRPHNRPAASSPESKTDDEKLKLQQDNDPFAHPEPELTDFAKQDSLLKPVELQIMHAILKNINNSDECKKNNTQFFAFFNSGPESGYSQFHKHIQFLKLPRGFSPYQSGLASTTEFFLPRELNVNKHPLIYQNAKFKHWILKIKDSFEDEEERETILAMLYMFLISRVLNVSKSQKITRDKVSYNFMMMDDWMMAVPRSHAKYEDVWQNALGYMGLFSARDEDVRQKMLDLGFSKILEGCGFPVEEKEKEISYDGLWY